MSNETANIYNRPDTGQKKDVERGLVGANDTLAYVAPKKVMVMDTMDPHSSKVTDETDEVDDKSSDTDTEDTRYKKENFEKRYADARRGHEQYRVQKENEIKELKRKLRDAGPKFNPPKTPEELATFKEENPDLYNTMVSIAGLHTESEVIKIKEELEEVREKEEKASKLAAEASLRREHPDLDKIRTSEDYRLWVESQPEQIQDWIKGVDPVLASKGLDLYKHERGIKTQGAVDMNPKAKEPDPAEAVSIPSKPDVDTEKVNPHTMIWSSEWINKLDTKHRNPKTGMSDYEEWWTMYGQKALAEGRIR